MPEQNEHLPKDGWTCVDVEDCGDDTQQCKMCGVEKVRYVHFMKHPDLQELLAMGRVCAQKYSGDTITPKLLERNLRKRAERRRKWLERKWRVSQKGNEYLNVQGKNIGIFRRGSQYGYWRFWTEDDPILENGVDTGYCWRQEFEEFSSQLYDTKESAKLALFDEMWPAPSLNGEERKEAA